MQNEFFLNCCSLHFSSTLRIARMYRYRDINRSHSPLFLVHEYKKSHRTNDGASNTQNRTYPTTFVVKNLEERSSTAAVILTHIVEKLRHECEQ